MGVYRCAALCTLFLTASALPRFTLGQQYQDVGGIRYQVVRQEVPRTIAVPTTQPQQQTTYRQQVTTETVQHQQLYTVPVTQYQVVSRLHGRWNPFVTPYWTHHYEPVTVWQQQTATVQLPISRVAVIPETRTVQMPVTEYKTVNEVVERTIPIGPTPTALAAKPITSSGPTATIAALPSGSTTSTSAPSAELAQRPLGGQQLYQDPPKQSPYTPPATVSRY